MIRTIYKNIATGEKGGIRLETEKEISGILPDDNEDPHEPE